MKKKEKKSIMDSKNSNYFSAKTEKSKRKHCNDYSSTAKCERSIGSEIDFTVQKFDKYWRWKL